MPTNRASIKDVAATAGVSFKTVSRVVNGVATVDDDLRARVEAAIAELNYVPNTTARSLKTGAGTAVGVVVDSIDDIFFASVISAIEDRALTQGLGVVIASTGHDAEREREQLLRLASQNVRGVVLAPVADEHDYLTPYRSRMPLVAIDRAMPGYDSVTGDDYAGARVAVEALIAGGHRRIALLGWDPSFATAVRRREGYTDVLGEHGIPAHDELVPYVSMTGAAATDALSAVLGLDDPPTALFLSNARHAANVVSALHALGRDDLAIMSFGDFTLADAVRPAISCIDQDPREIGMVAFDRLVARLEDPADAPTADLLRTEFRPRESHLIAPPAGNGGRAR